MVDPGDTVGLKKLKRTTFPDPSLRLTFDGATPPEPLLKLTSVKKPANELILIWLAASMLEEVMSNRYVNVNPPEYGFDVSPDMTVEVNVPDITSEVKESDNVSSITPPTGYVEDIAVANSPGSRV